MNEPSIIDFIERTFKSKRDYFYFNRSLFYICDPSQPRTEQTSKKDLEDDLLTHQSEKMHSHVPGIRVFLSGIVGKMRQSRESQTMVLLGNAAWLRDQQFRKVTAFLGSAFWDKQPRQVKKVQHFLNLLTIFGSTLDENAQLKSFLFGEFQFEFDSMGQNLLGLQFKLITQYSSFTSRAEGLLEYPVIYIFLDDFFCSGTQESLLRFLPDQAKQMQHTLNSNPVLKERVGLLKKQLYQAVEALNLDPTYFQEMLYMVLSLFYFNNLKCESGRKDEWKLVQDLVHDELIQILGVDQGEFFPLLVEVFTADDGSMEFHKKTSDFKNTIKLIGFTVYEKILFDLVQRMNRSFPKCGESKNLRIQIPFFPDWSAPEGAFYDDLHLNFLNEMMMKFYSDSIVEHERAMYREEGLGKHFPKGHDSPHPGTRVLKVLDSFRDPPGLFQLLETANKLNKTNQMFLNNLVKFFKSSPAVQFNKFKKHLVTLVHSNGPVCYDFSGFNETNKYFLDQDYKTLFKNFALRGILDKHEYPVESINKVYKSDIYRTLLKEYLAGLSARPLSFFNCLQRGSSQHRHLLTQLRMYKLVDLVGLTRHLFPIKMKLRRFCRRYLEVDFREDAHFETLSPSRDLRKVAMKIFKAVLSKPETVYGTEQIREKSKTREGIMNAHNRGDVLRQTHLIGVDRVFLREGVYDLLEARLHEIESRQERWREYLLTKTQRFRRLIQIRRMLARFKKNKALARQSIGTLLARAVHRPKFLLTLRTVDTLQHNFLFRRRLRMMRLFLSRMNMIKNKFRAKRFVEHTLRLRMRIIKVQRRVRRFLTFQKIKKRLEVKDILFELADLAADEAHFRRITEVAIYIQKCWRRKLVYRRYKREIAFLDMRREERLRDKMARRIQRNWRLVRWRFRVRRYRASADIIRKNFLAYIWRKNFLTMKRGVVRVQRMFRQNRDQLNHGHLDYFLRQSRFEDLLKSRKRELLQMAHALVEENLRNETKKEERLQQKIKPGASNLGKKGVSVYAQSPTTLAGAPRLRMFSLLVDFESYPNEAFFNFGDYFNGFSKLFGQMRRHGEVPVEFHCADSHMFTLSDRFAGYYWGECEFVYRKVLDKEMKRRRERWKADVHRSLRENLQEKECRLAVHRVGFWGRKPVGVSSGSDFCAFLYPDNEVKCFGTFDVYSATHKIKRVKDKLTLKLSDDFHAIQMDAAGKTLALLSAEGTALLWPFYNPAKKTISRVRLSLPAKIKQVACGVDFVVMRDIEGQVFSMGHTNSCGELGFGQIGFPFGQPEQRLRKVALFSEHGERVKQLAVGMKHVLALTQRNRVFAWGANFKGQLGQGDKANYSLPRLVVLPDNQNYNAKILWVECGKFSSYILMRNNRVYEFGANGHLLDQRRPVLLDLGFETPLLRNQKEFHICRVKSSWSGSMEVTYLQLSRVRGDMRTSQNKAVINKTLKHWDRTNIMPSYIDLQMMDNPIKLKNENHKSYEIYRTTQLMFREEFREQQMDQKNCVLWDTESVNRGQQMCVIDDELLTFEKILENWEVWEVKYKDLKRKVREAMGKATDVLSEDEHQFMIFFQNVFKVLMG